MKDIVIFGAGGLGKEIASGINKINMFEKKYNLLGFVVDSEYYHENEIIYGLPVIGDREWLIENKENVFCVCALGHVDERKKVFEELKSNGIRFETIICADASVDLTAHIGEGVIISGKCGISVDVSIGDGCFLNSEVCIGHDTIVGNDVVINPRVQISGGCHIEDNVSIGTMSFLMEKIKVGHDAKIVPGSIVMKNVKANSYVMGNPAKRVEL